MHNFFEEAFFRRRSKRSIIIYSNKPQTTFIKFLISRFSRLKLAFFKETTNLKKTLVLWESFFRSYPKGNSSISSSKIMINSRFRTNENPNSPLNFLINHRDLKVECEHCLMLSRCQFETKVLKKTFNQKQMKKNPKKPFKKFTLNFLISETLKLAHPPQR